MASGSQNPAQVPSAGSQFSSTYGKTGFMPFVVPPATGAKPGTIAPPAASGMVSQKPSFLPPGGSLWKGGPEQAAAQPALTGVQAKGGLQPAGFQPPVTNLHSSPPPPKFSLSFPNFQVKKTESPEVQTAVHVQPTSSTSEEPKVASQIPEQSPSQVPLNSSNPIPEDKTEVEGPVVPIMLGGSANPAANGGMFPSQQAQNAKKQGIPQLPMFGSSPPFSQFGAKSAISPVPAVGANPSQEAAVTPVMQKEGLQSFQKPAIPSNTASSTGPGGVLPPVSFIPSDSPKLGSQPPVSAPKFGPPSPGSFISPNFGLPKTSTNLPPKSGSHEAEVPPQKGGFKFWQKPAIPVSPAPSAASTGPGEVSPQMVFTPPDSASKFGPSQIAPQTPPKFGLMQKPDLPVFQQKPGQSSNPSASPQNLDVAASPPQSTSDSPSAPKPQSANIPPKFGPPKITGVPTPGVNESQSKPGPLGFPPKFGQFQTKPTFLDPAKPSPAIETPPKPSIAQVEEQKVMPPEQKKIEQPGGSSPAVSSGQFPASGDRSPFSKFGPFSGVIAKPSLAIPKPEAAKLEVEPMVSAQTGGIPVPPQSQEMKKQGLSGPPKFGPPVPSVIPGQGASVQPRETNAVFPTSTTSSALPAEPGQGLSQVSTTPPISPPKFGLFQSSNQSPDNKPGPPKFGPPAFKPASPEPPKPPSAGEALPRPSEVQTTAQKFDFKSPQSGSEVVSPQDLGAAKSPAVSPESRRSEIPGGQFVPVTTYPPGFLGNPASGAASPMPTARFGPTGPAELAPLDQEQPKSIRPPPFPVNPLPTVDQKFGAKQVVVTSDIPNYGPAPFQQGQQTPPVATPVPVIQSTVFLQPSSNQGKVATDISKFGPVPPQQGKPIVFPIPPVSGFAFTMKTGAEPAKANPVAAVPPFPIPSKQEISAGAAIPGKLGPVTVKFGMSAAPPVQVDKASEAQKPGTEQPREEMKPGLPPSQFSAGGAAEEKRATLGASTRNLANSSLIMSQKGGPPPFAMVSNPAAPPNQAPSMFPPNTAQAAPLKPGLPFNPAVPPSQAPPMLPPNPALAAHTNLPPKQGPPFNPPPAVPQGQVPPKLPPNPALIDHTSLPPKQGPPFNPPPAVPQGQAPPIFPNSQVSPPNLPPKQGFSFVPTSAIPPGQAPPMFPPNPALAVSTNLPPKQGPPFNPPSAVPQGQAHPMFSPSPAPPNLPPKPGNPFGPASATPPGQAPTMFSPNTTPKQGFSPNFAAVPSSQTPPMFSTPQVTPPNLPPKQGLPFNPTSAVPSTQASPMFSADPAQSAASKQGFSPNPTPAVPSNQLPLPQHRNPPEPGRPDQKFAPPPQNLFKADPGPTQKVSFIQRPGGPNFSFAQKPEAERSNPPVPQLKPETQQPAQPGPSGFAPVKLGPGEKLVVKPGPQLSKFGIPPAQVPTLPPKVVQPGNSSAKKMTCANCRALKSENQFYSEIKCREHDGSYACYKCIEANQAKACPACKREYSEYEVMLMPAYIESVRPLE